MSTWIDIPGGRINSRLAGSDIKLLQSLYRVSQKHGSLKLTLNSDCKRFFKGPYILSSIYVRVKITLYPCNVLNFISKSSLHLRFENHFYYKETTNENGNFLA